MTSTYAAKLSTPFAVLGVRVARDELVGIDFLAQDEAARSPRDPFSREVVRQLVAYLRDPDFTFDLPLNLAATTHQAKVWDLMTRIPRGEVMTYGDMAALVGSSPRAVGRACGDNPIPVIIPCHRVVSKSGVGGFMHQSGGDALVIKHWLLRHERRAA